MKNSLTITVTPDDIKRGLKKSATRDPIALALKRAIPRAENVTVLPQIFYWEHDGAEWTWRVPYAVEEFISMFDFGCAMKPISFTIRRKSLNQED